MKIKKRKDKLREIEKELGTAGFNCLIRDAYRSLEESLRECILDDPHVSPRQVNTEAIRLYDSGYVV
ncbi:MAG: hypothetical protein ACOCUU_00595 [Nanoarchaeota archaeon]